MKSMKTMINCILFLWFLFLTRPLLIFGQDFYPDDAGYGFCNSDRDCFNPWHGCVPHFFRSSSKG